MELATAIRSTERNDNCSDMNEEKARHFSAGLLYSFRTFLPLGEREELVKPITKLYPKEPLWLRVAHANSVAVRLPDEKTATDKQAQTALRVIDIIARKLNKFGYNKFSGVLRDYVAASATPARHVKIHARNPAP